MDQPLLHIKVGEKLKKRMQSLVDSGLFNNHTEIIREGLRDLISKYPEISDRILSKNSPKKNE